VHTNIPSRLNAANDFLVMTRYGDVQTIVRGVLAEDPENWFALSLLARALSGLDQHEEAVEAARSCLSAAPDSSEAHWQSGLVFLRAKKYLAAREATERALVLNPSHAYSHVLYATILSAFRSNDKALEELETAVRLDPQSADAWATRAIILAESALSEEAEAAAKEALRLAPDSSRSQLAAGVSALAALNPKKALARLRDGLRLDPQNAWALDPLVSAAKLRVPVYGSLFATARWRSLVFVCFLLISTAPTYVSFPTAFVLVVVAAIRKNFFRATFVSAVLPTIVLIIWSLYWIDNPGYTIFVLFLDLIVTSVLFASIDLCATVIVSFDPIVRHALRKREREIALWFLANVAAFWMGVIAAYVWQNIGVLWIAYACGIAAGLTAIYSQHYRRKSRVSTGIARNGLRVTAAAQAISVAAGICLLLTPQAPRALQDMHVSFPTLPSYFFVPALGLAFALSAVALSMYLMTGWLELLAAKKLEKLQTIRARPAARVR
jgi:tetratricopeptide (TPR) repeat protein